MRKCLAKPIKERLENKTIHNMLLIKKIMKGKKTKEMQGINRISPFFIFIYLAVLGLH